MQLHIATCAQQMLVKYCTCRAKMHNFTPTRHQVAQHLALTYLHNDSVRNVVEISDWDLCSLGGL